MITVIIWIALGYITVDLLTEHRGDMSPRITVLSALLWPFVWVIVIAWLAGYLFMVAVKNDWGE